MASLRKLRGKYYVRIRHNGKEKLIGTKMTTRRDAEIHLHKWQENEQLVKFNMAEHLLDTKLTIDECIEYFSKNYQTERGITDSTMKSYKLALRDFKNCYCFIKSFRELQRRHYPELVSYLKVRFNETTVNIRLRSIRTFLNYLLEVEKIKSIPFKIKELKIDKKEPKYLLPEELDSIYELVQDKKLLATYKTYEATGMRLSELENSFRDGNYIKIVKSKARKERIIPIADVHIADYDLAKDNQLSKTWISRSFSKYARMVCDSRKTIHCLRHTYAYKMLLKNNGSIQIVRDLLGHSSVKVTEIYTNIPQGYLKQIFEKTIIKSNIQAQA